MSYNMHFPNLCASLGAGLVLLLAVPAPPMAGQSIGPADAAGCYKLQIEDWPPTAGAWADELCITNDPPPYVQLLDKPAAAPTGWYRAWPPLVAMDRPHVLAEDPPVRPVWMPVGGDSLVVAWAQTLLGFEVRMGPSTDGVRPARVRAFGRPLWLDLPWSDRNPIFEGVGRAIRASCERLLPPPATASDSLDVVRAVVAEVAGWKDVTVHRTLLCNNFSDCVRDATGRSESVDGSDWLAGVFLTEIDGQPYETATRPAGAVLSLAVPVIHGDRAYVWIVRSVPGRRSVFRATVERLEGRWVVTEPPEEVSHSLTG
jgi:hypothetical protein